VCRLRKRSRTTGSEQSWGISVSFTWFP
jgi:hypothetical protein